MAYTRTQWVEQETPLSAQNMNNIEDGIEELQSTKVDKATGKGLSDQNYTAAEKTKLAGIAEGAEVNVQSDWNQTNTSADDYIKNKPGSASSSAAGLMSAADKSKLDGVQAGAQVNPGAATTSAAGLMSAADKSKLDGVQAGAQVNRTYTAVTGYPTEKAYPGFGGSFSVSQVSQDETGQVTLTRRLVEIPNRVASTSVPGLMSAADKLKLDSASMYAEENLNDFTHFSVTDGAEIATTLTPTSKNQNFGFRAGNLINLSPYGSAGMTISADMEIVTGTTDTSVSIPVSDRKTLTYKLDSRRRYSYAIPLKLSVPSGCVIGGYYPTTVTEGVYTYITALNVNVINVGTSAKSVSAGTTMPILLLG